MESPQTKTRIYADFSIETLLKKDDPGDRSTRKYWGIVGHQSFLSLPSVQGVFGENYYNPQLGNISSGEFFTKQEEITPAPVTHVETEEDDEEDEFISVSDDNEPEDPNGKVSGRDCTEVSDDGTFEWLTCTRFRPPKLPRPRRKNTSRRNGRGPRIPFSTHQLSVLESTFVNSQYLSSDAIGRLAENLNLTETRVKIWFQNRRARYRREKEIPKSHSHLGSFSTHTSFSSTSPELPTPPSHHPVGFSSKESFRHLINDLNLMAAAATTTKANSSIATLCGFDSHDPTRKNST